MMSQMTWHRLARGADRHAAPIWHSQWSRELPPKQLVRVDKSSVGRRRRPPRYYVANDRCLVPSRRIATETDKRRERTRPVHVPPQNSGIQRHFPGMVSSGGTATAPNERGERAALVRVQANHPSQQRPFARSDGRQSSAQDSSSACSADGRSWRARQRS